MEHFNKLNPAEAERLALLAEECAEVIQIVGKILRHGYESHNPFSHDKKTNRLLLMEEIGHILVATDMMRDAEDISIDTVVDAKNEKKIGVVRYLHHQGHQ